MESVRDLQRTRTDTFGCLWYSLPALHSSSFAFPDVMFEAAMYVRLFKLMQLLLLEQCSLQSFCYIE